MVNIRKGNTQSVVVVTLSENINKYPTETYDPMIFVTDDLYGNTYSIYPLTDISASQGRYNKFIIDETDYDFRVSMHTYIAYMGPTSSSVLEIGKWNVTGTISSTSSIYYNNVYQ
jgi:hypothetical protein